MNPYFVLTTLGGSLSLLLSVTGAAAPVFTKGVLPIGGSDFMQTAIILVAAIALAAIFDIWSKWGK